MNKWNEQVFCAVSHAKQKRKAQWHISMVLKDTQKKVGPEWFRKYPPYINHTQVIEMQSFW